MFFSNFNIGTCVFDEDIYGILSHQYLKKHDEPYIYLAASKLASLLKFYLQNQTQKMIEQLNKIKELIANDSMNEAFKLLKQLPLKDYPAIRNEIILQQSRFLTNRKNQIQGLVDSSSISITKNQIVTSILEIINKIEKFVIEEQEKKLKLEKDRKNITIHKKEDLKEDLISLEKTLREIKGESFEEIEIEFDRQDNLINEIDRISREIAQLNAQKDDVINNMSLKKINKSPVEQKIKDLEKSKKALQKEMKYKKFRKNKYLDIEIYSTLKTIIVKKIYGKDFKSALFKMLLKQNPIHIKIVNSENAYYHLKSIEKTDYVIYYLSSLVGDPRINFEVAGKALLMLKYFRRKEAIIHIKIFSRRDYKRDIIVQNYFHNIGVEYLTSIRDAKINEFRDNVLFSILKDCPSKNAKVNAFKYLIKRVNNHNNDFINEILDIVSKESTIESKLEFIKTLKFLTFNEDQIQLFISWLLDPSIEFKLEVIGLLKNYFNLVDFNIILEYYRFEDDENCKIKLIELLNLINPQKAQSIINSSLTFEKETFLIKVINYYSETNNFTGILYFEKLKNEQKLSPKLSTTIDNHIEKYNRLRNINED